LIVMGASLGGARAVQTLLAALPATFATPIALVLHRHRDSDVGLAALLQRSAQLRVSEATDKQAIEAGTVYVAPADYHLLIDGTHLALSIDEPLRFARPSVDVLFESAAAAYGSRVIGIVLTGGGVDGAQGAAAIEAAGGRVLVQNPNEAACGDMPSSAIAATDHAEILELELIACRLMQLVK
jgi:two-component system, chemotaxis family, protein-glutamate methylesterase/glutaminase